MRVKTKKDPHFNHALYALNPCFLRDESDFSKGEQMKRGNKMILFVL